MAAQQSDFPQDEFDSVAPGPTGAHRGKKSSFSRLLPYLVVIVVAACAGMLVFAWLTGLIGSNSSLSSSSTTTTSASKSTSTAKKSKSSSASSSSSSSADSSSDSSSSSSSASASESSSATASSSGTVDMSASVIVYNGNQVSGYAAAKAAILTTAGYTNVTSKNPSSYSNLPSVGTVWYSNSEDQATAQDIASRLGYTNVVQTTGISADIAVIAK